MKSHTKVAAIVGYTNAGKSTLLNTLTDADVLEEDQLFATLDPTTRSAGSYPSGQELTADRYRRFYPEAAASSGRCF